MDRAKRCSRNEKAGLNFPVSRVQRYLRKRCIKKRISVSSAVYLTATLEYLTAEVLELSGNAARSNCKIRILPRHIFLAVSHDEELCKFLGKIIIPEGGVMPSLHPFLMASKAKKSTKISLAKQAHKVKNSYLFASPAKNQKQLKQSMNITTSGHEMSPVLDENGDLIPSVDSTTDQLSVYNFEEESDSNIVPLKNPLDDVIKMSGDYKILFERILTSFSISVIEGNIFKVPSDAIINPVKSDLYMSSPTGKMLLKKGGLAFRRIINKMRVENAPLAPSNVVLSCSMNTAAKFVIHCNVPDTEEEDFEMKLMESITSCLNLANELKVTSIVLPLVGNGQSKLSTKCIVKANIESIKKYFASFISTTWFHLNLVPFNAQSLNDVIDEVCQL